MWSSVEDDDIGAFIEGNREDETKICRLEFILIPD